MCCYRHLGGLPRICLPAALAVTVRLAREFGSCIPLLARSRLAELLALVAARSQESSACFLCRMQGLCFGALRIGKRSSYALMASLIIKWMVYWILCRDVEYGICCCFFREMLCFCHLDTCQAGYDSSNNHAELLNWLGQGLVGCVSSLNGRALGRNSNFCCRICRLVELDQLIW